MFFNNILVPVDFSVNSTETFELAQQLSLQYNSVLHLLHIIDPLIYAGINDESRVENIMQARYHNADEELKKFVHEIANPRVRICAALKSGKPHEEVIRYSKENKIDLIVIATHGWTGHYHLPMGNVAEKILKFSGIPVICMKTSRAVLKKDSINYRTLMAENWVG